MVILGIFLLLVLWTIGVRQPEHTRSRPWPSLFWRLALVIAAVRIGALWLGVEGLRRSDWLQVPAYLLVMTGWPDLYLARFARAAPVRWAIWGSLILAVSSLPWSGAFLWLAEWGRTKSPINFRKNRGR